jgi:hypothetical protein
VLAFRTVTYCTENEETPLKKKLGLEITSEKKIGTDRVYRITNPTV